ncbi:RNA 2',3'-cyclic phosphodiesterase [Candidatus Micrarchaeota archaeon CG10_big_fil_rev_8_21_14_0_10_45_29]|nr:MAG: RNA 2',3'-cyclic phosphodiesterase [Candidatus Micrarchaeota archaeon CG10_big_fil_rev_8_21_14_0_10_45_29]
MRIFIAIPLPEEIKAHLLSLQQKLSSSYTAPKIGDSRPYNPKGYLQNPKSPWRPSKEEHMHLTLQFLGDEATLHQTERIKEKMREISSSASPFQIECTNVGAFPNAKNARVLWVGAKGEGLVQLAKKVREECAKEGFSEGKPFSAHLTFARSKFSQDASKFLEETNKTPLSLSWIANSFCLMQSDEILGGHEHNLLEKFELKK